MPSEDEITAAQYEAMAEFRRQIRQFLRFSETASRSAGLQPRQHQLLLMLKGQSPEKQTCITDLAEQLLIPHHTAVNLVDGLRKRSLVDRRRSSVDRRKIVVTITPFGEEVLHTISLRNLAKLRSTGPALRELLNKIMDSAGSS